MSCSHTEADIPHHPFSAPQWVETKNKKNRTRTIFRLCDWLLCYGKQYKTYIQTNKKMEETIPGHEFCHVVGRLKSNHMNQTHNTFFLFFFTVVPLKLSHVLPHCSYLPWPCLLPQSIPTLLSTPMGPLYMFLNLLLPILSTIMPIPPPLWLLSFVLYSMSLVLVLLN